MDKKKLLKVFICLALLFSVSMTGCDKQPVRNAGNKPSKPSASQRHDSSESDGNNSGDNTSVSPTNGITHKPDSAIVESTRDTDSADFSYRSEYTEKETSKIIDTDGCFAYKTNTLDISKGYVIIIPRSDDEALKSAQYFKKYYDKQYSADISVFTDDKPETLREILIGKTSRRESNGKLQENSLSVSVVGKKLVLDGGHNVTVDSAVKKFIRLLFKTGKVCTFSHETDFSSVMNGYKYVWGDEFEDLSLNRKKWSLTEPMYGTKILEVASGKDVIDVGDGRLKLRAVRTFNPNKQGIEYQVPCAVSTLYNMNYTYGYAEIRAKVPFKSGAWPGFWTNSTDKLSGRRNPDYYIEVDVFENMGSIDTLIPAIHTWYKDKHFSTGNNRKVYKFDSVGNLSNEYHIYGYEWTMDEISMYVDGKKYNTFDITKTFDGNNDLSGFNDAQFLMFTNHLFVSDSELEYDRVVNRYLPYEFYIDYLRLYQKDGQGNLFVNETEKE